MTDILSDNVMRCRKPKRCEQCGEMIEVGQRYRKQVYVDGELCIYRAHEDCDVAAFEHMVNYGHDHRSDDPIMLCDAIGPEDRQWLTEKYPFVAQRLFKS